MTRAQLLKSLRSLITYHRSCGIECYPDTPRMQSSLQSFSGLTRISPREPAADISVARSFSEPVADKTEPVVADGTGFEDLTREITACRICPLHESRKISTAGRGGHNPLLLIVGEWLGHDKRVRGDEVFGIEQDQMLGNMIKAMGLGPDDVFVTNIIKCSVDPRYRAVNKHLASCISYLKQQIVLLRPRVICTMGPVASRSLLNTGESLIGLRGKFHPYVLADDTKIDVMPTFHPTYLMTNPEMKKATWDDLQMIAKLLQRV